MMRYVLVLLVLVMAGCKTCEPPTFFRKPDSPDPWNTNYLLDADPGTVTIAALHSRADLLTSHYWDYSQVNGVIWPAYRSDSSLPNPDRWVNGGDSGIYTGQMLATVCFEYGTLKTDAALQRVTDTLRGLYILTHATGTPGVIQRNAFPASQPDKFGYPQEWGSRIARGFVHTGPPLIDPFSNAQIPPSTYYTRGTKDQLTGMVMGLAAVWRIMDPATVAPAHQAQAVQLRDVAKRITAALYGHLKYYDWKIRDEYGKNDTNADYVDGLLRACVLGLTVHMGATALQEDYDDTFDAFIDLSSTLAYTDRMANFFQYYAHNLRASRALTIWLLEGAGSDKGTAIARYVDRNLWRFVQGHQSAWFAFLHAALNSSGSSFAVTEGLQSLRSLSLKPIRMWSSPYHGQEQKPDLISSLICVKRYIVDPRLRKPEDYTTWQKEPWDVGMGTDWDQEGRGDSSGLDYLLPYWMARFYNLF